MHQLTGSEATVLMREEKRDSAFVVSIVSISADKSITSASGAGST